MINFSNARVLSYDHNHLFFGENFRYAVRRNISLEGAIYSLGNTSGVAPVWEGISGFVGSATDYSTVLINGIDFGPGRVENISFEPSVDVTRKDYRVSITTFDSGNLFNMSGVYYDGLDFNNPEYPAYLLENFNEDFSYSLEESKEESWSQSLTLKFVSGAANGTDNNPIQMAKNFASGLFANSPGFLLFGTTNAYALNTKKFFKESYDQITNECSFSFDQKVRRDSQPYSFVYTHSINTNEEGITTVEENGKFQGLAEDLYTNAKLGYTTEFGFSYSRCSDSFDEHKPVGAQNLNTNYINLSRQDNKFEGIIEYNVNYSNDPRINDGYSWEYTQEIDRREDCVIEVSERGRILGLSTECSQANKYQNASEGWVIVKEDLDDRVTTFYEDVSGRTRDLKMFSKTETKSQFEGSIEYDAKYTDDPTQNVDGFRKVDATIEDSFPLAKVAKFQILGVKELVQPQNISTPGQRTLALNLRGSKTTTLDTYKAYAKTFANQHIPTTVSEVYIDNCNYNWTPNESAFDCNVSWVFFGNRAFSSTTL